MLVLNTTLDPIQIDEEPPTVTIAVGKAFTAIDIVVELAHKPDVGVKVYVVVAMLFNAGDHVPMIPFVELVGSAPNVAPLQIGATCVKVGVVDVVIDTAVAVDVLLHPFEFVITTVYEPAVVAVYVAVVTPLIAVPFLRHT